MMQQHFVFTRRQALQGAGAATLAFSLSGGLFGCSSLPERKTADGALDQQDSIDLKPELFRILHFASLAPSSHNTQPWRVRVSEQSRWRITLDSDRFLPEVDPRGREMVVSLGCFLENLERAAAANGYLVETAISGSDATSLVVETTLSSAKPSNENLEALALRRTIKSNLENTPLSASQQASLTEAGSGSLAFFPMESSQGRRLSDIAKDAMSEQMAREQARKEFAEWVHLKPKIARTRRDGLTPKSMEVPAFVGWWMRHFMDKRDLASEDFAKKTVDVVAKQVRQGAGWVAVRSEGQSVEEWVAAGRAWQRIALAMQPLDIGLHPMSQALEESKGARALEQLFGRDHNTQMLARIGRADPYGKPVSLRRPVPSFVTL